MALSGSFNTTAYKGRYLTFSWTATQNVAANTSTLSWKLVGAGTGSGYYKSGNFKVVIAGETVYSSATRIELRVGTVVAQGTKTITHNGDGTKSFSASAEAGIYTVAVNCRGSSTFTLNTIPRASTMSCGPGVINGWHTITINRASSAFTHTVTYKFGSLTGSVYTKTNQTSLTWIIPYNFYTQIPNAKSGTCTLTCQTYNGGTLIGTTTTTFTASVNENECKPTLTPFVYDTNPTTKNLTGNDTVLVRYHSNAYCEANPEARKSATLASTVIQVGSDGFLGAEYTFNNINTNTVKFITTDSRGLTATKTETTGFVEYIHLSCILGDEKPGASGSFTFKVRGKCFNGNFGVTNNSLYVHYRFKADNEDYCEWQLMEVSRTGDDYTAEALVSGLDYRKTYTFQAKAQDALETVTTDSAAVKSLPVFDWSGEDFNFNVPVNFKEGATGIGGGGGTSDYNDLENKPSIDGVTLEGDKTPAQLGLAAENHTHGYMPLTGGTFTGNVTIKKGTSNYGGKLNFGDGDYVHLYEKSDDKLEIKAKSIDLVCTNLTQNGQPIEGGSGGDATSGTWTPSVINASTYSTRQGWYQKVGKVVTIGFLVSGKWNSRAATTFEMYGLPFTCGAVMAAGGGVIFNGRVSKNTIFCGWVVLPNSTTIGARTYPLPTGTGGLPLGAGINTNPNQNFTVSGTITYMTA